MTAEGSVVIEKGGERLEAGRAVYTATDGLLNLENHPSWRAGLREGNGDSITILVPRNEMEVRGHATMRLPAGELSGLSQPHTGASGELPRREGAGSPFARITSSEYRFTEGSAHFSGGVAIDHPQMAWSCENLAVEFSPQGGTVHTIVADQRLVFDLSDNQGQQIHGTGDRAFYAVSSSGGKTNEVVTLTGEPAVLERTNAVVRNSVIILDRSNNKLVAPGKYEISAWTGSPATNVATWPEKP